MNNSQVNSQVKGKQIMAKIKGTAGNDILTGTGGNDEIEGLAGNDVLQGLAGNDEMEGGDGLDTLDGGAGNDSLEGNKGDDTMIGGQGNDTLEWEDGDGSDLMSGRAGHDVIEVEGSVKLGDDFVLEQSGTKAIFDRVNLVPFRLTVDSSEEFEVEGIGGNDSFTVGDLSKTEVKRVNFSGGAGNDILDASESSTLIYADGGSGNDALTGSSANDTLIGGTGDDFVQGEKGDDTMIGGSGNDLLVWDDGDGSDLISGGAGNDTVGVRGSVSQGDDFTLQRQGTKAIFDRINLVPFKLTVDTAETFIVQGDVGNDTFDVDNLNGTGVKSVQFSGGAGFDLLDGSDTRTPLIATGDGGNDTLIGGSGNDNLDGGAGDDVLNGRGGNDTLTGGTSGDDFDFGVGAAFSPNALGIDIITNFSRSQGDHIRLEQATFGPISHADIKIVANDAAAAVSAGLITYSQGTGNLFYNANGAAAGLGAGGQFAALTGAPTLIVGDFEIVSSFVS
jgi:Ca2+-binding RTX toxin-like protein